MQRFAVHRRWFVLAITAGALALVPPACAQQRPFEPFNPAKAQSLPFSPMEIEVGGKRVPFQVEVARTPGEQSTGMMHRNFMAEDHGMLFVYNPPRDTNYWMRNTFIPLDMIFADAKGTIIYIAADVQPHVETTVGAHRPSSAMLEVNAGTAARLGLKVGDRLHHATFGN